MRFGADAEPSTLAINLVMELLAMTTTDYGMIDGKKNK